MNGENVIKRDKNENFHGVSHFLFCTEKRLHSFCVDMYVLNIDIVKINEKMKFGSVPVKAPGNASFSRNFFLPQ